MHRRRSAGARKRPPGPSGGIDPAADRVVLPLLAEKIAVSKRRVATGRVRVAKTTRQYDHLVDELLAHEKVEIERIAIGEPVEEMPPVREEGNTIVIPVVEEIVVVERRLVLKEEIRVRRVATTQRHQEQVKLRKQEVVITRVPIEAASTQTEGTTAERHRGNKE